MIFQFQPKFFSFEFGREGISFFFPSGSEDIVTPSKAGEPKETWNFCLGLIQKRPGWEDLATMPQIKGTVGLPQPLRANCALWVCARLSGNHFLFSKFLLLSVPSNLSSCVGRTLFLSH